MAQRLLHKGADIDYVNSNGFTALHLCLENLKLDAVKFLLDHSANPHIMDLTGQDVCDKASQLGLSHKFPELNACQLRLKIPPKLPNNESIKFTDLPFFCKQKEKQNSDIFDHVKKLYNLSKNNLAKRGMHNLAPKKKKITEEMLKEKMEALG